MHNYAPSALKQAVDFLAEVSPAPLPPPSSRPSADTPRNRPHPTLSIALPPVHPQFQHELPLDLLVSPARPFAALPEAVREADLRFWPRVAVDLSGASQPPDQRGHEGPHLRATHVNASP